jgi:hypothetical protein
MTYRALKGFTWRGKRLSPGNPVPNVPETKVPSMLRLGMIEVAPKPKPAKKSAKKTPKKGE